MSIHSTESPSPAPIVRGPTGKTYETNPTGKAGKDMRQGNPPPTPGPIEKVEPGFRKRC
jgi:hypothetical protein